MKTVKKGKVIKRVSDNDAEQQVKKGWKYCSKSEWREKVRDAEPVDKKKVKKKVKKKEYGTHKLVHIKTQSIKK